VNKLSPEQQWLRNGLEHERKQCLERARTTRLRGTRHREPYAEHGRRLAALHHQCAEIWQAAIADLERKGSA